MHFRGIDWMCLHEVRSSILRGGYPPIDTAEQPAVQEISLSDPGIDVSRMDEAV